MALSSPEPYGTVKSMIMRRSTKSETKNLNQLLYTSRVLLDEKLDKFMGSCRSDQDNWFLIKIFLDHLPSNVCQILTIYGDESFDNLAQFADWLFDDKRRATTQTDKSNFRCSTTPVVAELSASLDRMKCELQFLWKW